MNFYEHAGKLALASRLRQLADHFTMESASVYKAYNVDLNPKWFPVVYVLQHGESSTVTQIAKDIGQSHPSVSQTLQEMSAAGLITKKRSKTDSRKTEISLSAKAKRLLIPFEEQCEDVMQAVVRLEQHADTDLWDALSRTESQLQDYSWSKRVEACRQERKGSTIKIVNYEDKYQQDFKTLNQAWIEKYWTLEDADRKALDHPDKYIIEPGGRIYLATLGGEVIGTCALIKMNDETYELAKMTVANYFKGKGIGYRLGQKVIEAAQALGASVIYLESNSILEPAINLYKKLGFKEVAGATSPYTRCDIQMELRLAGHKKS